jgi:cell division protein FtsQ
MPVSVPADRRLRRPHVRPARRRSWRALRVKGALIGLAVILAGTLCYTAAVLALSSGALTVRRISVTGNERVSIGEVHALLQGVIGSNVLTADIEGWRQRLRDSPWVADAVVRRVFPRSISVTLSERHPIGIGRINAELFLIDRSGTVIDVRGPDYADLDLPMIDGLAARRGGALLIDPDGAATLAALFAALRGRPDLGRLISQIDVSDTRDVIVVFQGDSARVHIGADQFVERLQLYVEAAAALHERVLDIGYVDLRYGEQIIVGPSQADVRAGNVRRRRKG